MAWESIGSISASDMPHDEAWMLLGLDLAKRYIEFVCGPPPEESKLAIMWHDHEMGSYPSLGVWADDELPWDYIHACERALEVFDEAVSWHELKEHSEEQASGNENEDEDEDDQDDSDET